MRNRVGCRFSNAIASWPKMTARTNVMIDGVNGHLCAQRRRASVGHCHRSTHAGRAELTAAAHERPQLTDGRSDSELHRSSSLPRAGAHQTIISRIYCLAGGVFGKSTCCWSIQSSRALRGPDTNVGFPVRTKATAGPSVKAGLTISIRNGKSPELKSAPK
jgi:hypothetical protein